MIANLKDYQPKDVKFILSDNVKDIFPIELDFTKIKGKKIKNAADAIKLVSKEFTATFPTGEMAERELDDHEVSEIREEYCVKCENDLPEAEQNLEKVLEEIKSMKKHAEELLTSVRQQIATYAAQVKQGTQDVRLITNETFCIALAGYYVYYTYDRNKQKFILAKAHEVGDRTEIWSQEDKNRKAMLDFFGLEFPEPEKPQEEAEEPQDSTDGDELPFPNED